ncbi:MAG: hypothetical protein M0C28_30020 [Candidatus Moduliflexus flocculans]|nr:hypothetical protein [Candidatus Moduliflexus flocculans]
MERGDRLLEDLHGTQEASGLELAAPGRSGSDRAAYGMLRGEIRGVASYYSMLQPRAPGNATSSGSANPRSAG